jgi:RNA polymerase sigma-70 factor (ECF subfamily)
MTHGVLKQVPALMSKPTPHDRFLTLLDQHKGILFKIANAYGRGLAAREDLVQEMILQLWRSFGRYDDRHRFTTWMYRVALNVAISSYRRERRRPRTGVLEGALDVAAASATPTQQEDFRLLEEFIAQLNELDRALVLLYMDGHGYDTIAEILGITETNVGTKLGRIKDKFRRMAAGHAK